MTSVRARLAIASMVAVAVLPGCGGDPRTTVVEDDVVQRRDVVRQVEGTPERAVIEFARFVQWDDPVATEELLSERWRMSVSEVAAFLRTAGPLARAMRVPRIVDTSRRGGRAGVTGGFGGQKVALDLVRERGRWKIDRIRIGTIDLPGDGEGRP